MPTAPQGDADVDYGKRQILVGCFFCHWLRFVQIPVEHRKAHKESEADEIFNRFDVLVKIHQCVNRLRVPNCA